MSNIYHSISLRSRLFYVVYFGETFAIVWWIWAWVRASWSARDAWWFNFIFRSPRIVFVYLPINSTFMIHKLDEGNFIASHRVLFTFGWWRNNLFCFSHFPNWYRHTAICCSSSSTLSEAFDFWCSFHALRGEVDSLNRINLLSATLHPPAEPTKHHKCA